MNSTSDMDLPITDDDGSDLHCMDEEEKTQEEDDYIEDAEINETDYKISSEEQQHYTVLTESDIKRLQDEDINQVSCVLFVPRTAACLLLVHHEWSVVKVHEAWFNNEEKVRKVVGLMQHEALQVGFPNSKTLQCEICLNVVSGDKVRSAGCGHLYCMVCWKLYVDVSIDAGPERCLKLRCPRPNCDISVGGDMIFELASGSRRNRYDCFLLRSYVENNKKMKWCPAPACEYAVIYEPDGVRTNSDVTCLCCHSFCWSCGEEAHSPLDCETAKHWIMKNDSESSGNAAWILTNTKPCPYCKKPIEKDEGCMLMECKCGFHFCWLCLREWAKCGCSRNHVADEDNNKKEVKRKVVRDYLRNYNQYYEGWRRNDFSRKIAVRQMREVMNSGYKMKLGMLYGRAEDEFVFIEVAWKAVVECERVLKWSHPYGYYLPPREEAKREYYEYNQRQAETVLRKLKHCVEMELQVFLNGNEPIERFDSLRLKVVELTRITKTYFQNFVSALEKGLEEVQVSRYRPRKRVEMMETGESSSAKKKRIKTDSI
ncbi:unnamed protein product [Sphenostylis stenocarpa]|uniref:RBR-type E3 ubiquitin transferase n=1 Tax=Sphenostylis stenocarpa TaxID=92480 RepID=A0AA86RXS8_9FABA|nr:unnamed protein product [Sphenostylis stenocarpa]